jgi:hypothetical protein
MKIKMKTLLRGTAFGTTALFIAGGAFADQVFNDDLIVTQSLCVGTDCVNGEVFGADTIRLKENNLRIHFQDTSSSGSFPSADWRLIANDSTNGGANYFAIEDSDLGRKTFTIEQGAPANALYMSDGGDLGIGTATPVVEVQAVDGNSPTLRLEQNGSSGFAPQTWDLAGNETNFFVRDVTNGSQLPFRIRPGADTGSLTIGADGNVGMGVGNDTSPDASLQVKRTDGTAQVLVQDTGGSGPRQLIRMENDGAVQLYMDNTSNANAQWLFSAGASLLLAPNDNPSNAVFDLASNGNLQIDGTLTQSSDKHRKMAIVPVNPTEILEKVRAMPVAEWTYKHDAETGVRHIGPMAQDFYAAFGTGADDKGISSLDGTGVALAAIQALSDENATLRARLDALEAQVQAD